MNTPSLGIAAWLLNTPLPERMEWIADNGFDGASLLQSFIDIDPIERQEAAAVIRNRDLALTYHGNVHHRRESNDLVDTSFVHRVIEDALWWHENAAPVASVCFDAIHFETEDDPRVFLPEENARVVRLMSEGLSGSGIRVGIENAYGSPRSFCTQTAFSRFLASCDGDKPGMLYDAGHANIHIRSGGVLGEDSIEKYTTAIPFDILEVHVSDNRGSADEHRNIGHGNLDLDALATALGARGFQNQVTIEVCLDIANGFYAFDLGDPGHTAGLLATRDALRAAWESH